MAPGIINPSNSAPDIPQLAKTSDGQRATNTQSPETVLYQRSGDTTETLLEMSHTTLSRRHSAPALFTATNSSPNLAQADKETLLSSTTKGIQQKNPHALPSADPARTDAVGQINFTRALHARNEAILKGFIDRYAAIDGDGLSSNLENAAERAASKFEETSADSAEAARTQLSAAHKNNIEKRLGSGNAGVVVKVPIPSSLRSVNAPSEYISKLFFQHGEKDLALREASFYEKIDEHYKLNPDEPRHFPVFYGLVSTDGGVELLLERLRCDLKKLEETINSEIIFEGITEFDALEIYAYLTAEMLRTVCCLESANIHHNDFALKNIMLDDDGQLKLVDFEKAREELYMIADPWSQGFTVSTDLRSAAEQVNRLIESIADGIERRPGPKYVSSELRRQKAGELAEKSQLAAQMREFAGNVERSFVEIDKAATLAKGQIKSKDILSATNFLTQQEPPFSARQMTDAQAQAKLKMFLR